MAKSNKKRIVLTLPAKLLDLTDEASTTLQISRLGLIRQAIALRLAAFDREERPVIEGVLNRRA